MLGKYGVRLVERGFEASSSNLKYTGNNLKQVELCLMMFDVHFNQPPSCLATGTTYRDPKRRKNDCSPECLPNHSCTVICSFDRCTVIDLCLLLGAFFLPLVWSNRPNRCPYRYMGKLPRGLGPYIRYGVVQEDTRTPDVLCKYSQT